jgi:hypothetical protein
MDETRERRLKDRARQTWYNTWRAYRFAWHMGMRHRVVTSYGTAIFSAVMQGFERQAVRDPQQ